MRESCTESQGIGLILAQSINKNTPALIESIARVNKLSSFTNPFFISYLLVFFEIHDTAASQLLLDGCNPIIEVIEFAADLLHSSNDPD